MVKQSIKVVAVAILSIAAEMGCAIKAQAQDIQNVDSLIISAKQSLERGNTEDAFSTILSIEDIDIGLRTIGENNVQDDFLDYSSVLSDKFPNEKMYATYCFAGYHIQRKYALAIKYLLRTLKLAHKEKNPDETYSMICCGISNELELMNMYDEALNYINKSIDIAPIDYYELAKGKILFRANRYQDFINYISDEHHFSLSDSIDALSNLGWAYLRTGKLSDAKTSFEKCISMMDNENYSHILYYRGYTNMLLGDSISARHDFTQALEMAYGTDYIEPLLKANYYLGNIDIALHIADKVLADPDMYDYYLDCCKIYALCGNADKVVKILNFLYVKYTYCLTPDDIKYDTDFDGIRDDESLQEVLSRNLHHYDNDRTFVKELLNNEY